MAIGTFLVDVICAPYSIPIGLFNYKVKTIGMCSTTSEKGLDINEETSIEGGYSGRVGHDRADITSGSEYSILNRAIQQILTDASNKETRAVETEQTFVGSCPPVLSLEEDPDSTYTTNLYNHGEMKMGNDGYIYEIQTFGCCPDIKQQSTITVTTFEDITENHYESIYNLINVHLQSTLTEVGSDEPSSVDMSVLSQTNIVNGLKQNIRSKIENQTNQNVNVKLTMDYTDRYGRCSYDYDENGYLIIEETSCSNGLCGGKPKVLEQTVTIDILTKNIIDTSIQLIMENHNTIQSDTTVTVNRITNYRVIVVSLLWNVIVLFILFKIFGVFLRRIN